jgi:ribosomal protein S10
MNTKARLNITGYDPKKINGAEKKIFTEINYIVSYYRKLIKKTSNNKLMPITINKVSNLSGITMPMKKKHIFLLKSPFIFNKSGNRYTKLILKRLIYLKLNVNYNLISNEDVLKYLEKPLKKLSYLKVKIDIIKIENKK